MRKMKLFSLACVLTTALVIGGCGSKTNTESTESSSQTESQSETESTSEKESQKDTSSEKDTEKDSQGTEMTTGDTEKNTEKETEKDSEKNSESDPKPNTGNSTTDNNKNNESSTPEKDTSKNETVNTESGNGITPTDKTTLYGEGTAKTPYDALPVFNAGTADDAIATGDSSMKLTTVAIDAGKSVHYSIARIGGGGVVCTVNDKNAYIVCNNEKYTPQNGVITFNVPSGVDRVKMEIGNSSSIAQAFELHFTFVVGSYDNPNVITDLNSRTTNLEAGDEDGYYFKYTTTQGGTLRFYMSEATGKNADIYVTIIDNGIPVQRFFSADAANGYMDVKGAMGKDLKAGLTVLIQVVAVPELGGTPEAVSVTWSAEYK